MNNDAKPKHSTCFGNFRYVPTAKRLHPKGAGADEDQDGDVGHQHAAEAHNSPLAFAGLEVPRIACEPRWRDAGNAVRL
jgi:hypothetical protein